MIPPTPLLSSFWQRVLRRRRAPPPRAHNAVYEGVLGTSLHLHLVTEWPEAVRPAEDALFAEIERLERLFSRFDARSELNRWLGTAGQPVEVSPELGRLLSEAATWQHGTLGAFNPASDALSALWREAERAGQRPDPGELATLAGGIQAPLYSVGVGERTATRTSPLPLNFNAFAKGRVVDLAALSALAVPGVQGVMLNIGGDLRQLGGGSVAVNIADPFSRADNAPPVARVRVRGQAVATSGHTWRGFRVGGQWYSHVLDPRTGWPAQEVAGVSVIADDAATADVLATALNVLAPEDGLALADSLPRVGCHITTADHETLTNAFWQAHCI